jgi:hypothetical protein
MPLTELMNYFNDQLQLQARTKSLPTTGFYKAGNSYGARFGGLTFSSRFNAIKKHNGRNDIIGHDADLLVRAVTGKEFSVHEVFQSLDNTDQIIQLDRLTRTLHSLNYLQGYDNKALLSLTVQPRHIIAVTAEHGKTFEAILSDCGLGPERVMLHTRLLDNATLPHFRSAFISYRSLGYKLGIDIVEPSDLVFLEQLALEPDFILFHLPGAASVATPRKHGLQLHWLDPLHLYRNAQRILVGPESVLREIVDTGSFDGCVRKAVGIADDSGVTDSPKCQSLA